MALFMFNFLILGAVMCEPSSLFAFSSGKFWVRDKSKLCRDPKELLGQGDPFYHNVMKIKVLCSEYVLKSTAH